MLEQLDQIDWKHLNHAYGSAKDVPKLLRLLTDPRENVRQEALFELNSSLNHQGSLYEATPYAVPFLVELASDPSVPDRHNILSLVSGAAEGWTAALRDAPDSLTAPPLMFRASAERVASERPHREAAHRAVEREFAALERLLHDPDPMVRVAAPFVIANLFEHAESAPSLLRMIESEQDDWCRAGAILALEQLAHGSSPDDVTPIANRRFLEVFRDGTAGPDSRLSAGLALLFRGEKGHLEETLGLARPRLAPDLNHFLNLPSMRHSCNLFSLVTGSLRAWPEARVTWILEGLASPHANIASAAASQTGHLCREFRWGPSRMAPALRKLVDSPDPEKRSAGIHGLAELGSIGAESLWELADHPLEEVRTEAAARLARMRTRETERMIRFEEPPADSLPPVPSLIATIERHEGLRKWDDVEVVCRAVQSLGFHGTAAAEATEVVRRQIQHATTTISSNSLAASQLRITAIRALWLITQDADTVVPLAIQAVEPDRHGLLAIEQLREIGPAASAALPVLRRIAESERRLTPDGDYCGCCPDDEAFQTAAQVAIDAIAISS